MRFKNIFGLFILILFVAHFVSADVIVIIEQGNDIWNPKIVVEYTEDVIITENNLRDVNEIGTYGLLQDPPLGPPATYTKNHSFVTDDPNNPLLPSAYQFTLIAVDRQGIPVTNVVEFEIIGMNIELTDPENGWSSTVPYDVSWTTDKAAECRYQWYYVDPFTNWEAMLQTVGGQSASTTHSAPGQTLKGDFWVACRDGPEVTPARFFVGWDTSAPEISVVASPANVTDPRYKWTAVQVTANENTTCALEGENYPDEDPSDPNTFKEYHEKLRYFNDVLDENRHQYLFEVACENLAGLTATKDVDVTVNFGEFSDIQVLNPPELTNLAAFDLIVEPTFAAGSCIVNGEEMNPGSASNTFVKGFAKPFLQEGVNTFEINCTGAKNVSRIYEVTINSIAPSAPTLNASSAVCNNKIKATFNVSGGGIDHYNYSVRDGSGELFKGYTLGGSRQFVELDLGSRVITGTLTWSVYATDNAGNEGPTATQSIDDLHLGEDEECGLPPFVQLVKPPLGCGLSSPYPLEIRTSRTSECRYSTDPAAGWDVRQPLSSTDELRHTGSFNFFDANVEFLCRETVDDRDHFKTFYFCVDDTGPKIGVSAIPETVVSRTDAVVTLTVTTDDRTYCTYSGTKFDLTDDDTDQDSYKTKHETLIDFRSDPDESPHEVDYEIICENLAGLTNETEFTVLVNFGLPFDIEMVSPSSVTAASAITFSVQPNKPVTSCEWNNVGLTGPYEPFTTEQTGVFSESLGNLEEGTHEYWVTCLAATDQATKKFSFIVDRSTPKLDNVSGTSSVCVGTDIKYYYNTSGSLGTTAVEVSMDGPAGVTFEANSTAKFIEIPTTGVTPGVYTITFTPISEAGIRGSAVTKSVQVIDILAPACNVSPDHCTNGELDAGEDNVDCGGTCAACQTCTSSLQCLGVKICVEGVCIPPPPGPATCGNGAVDVGETCDGSNLAGWSCTGLGFTGGTLSCSSHCLLNSKSCLGPTNSTCGDGIIGVGETCDGSDVGGLACSDFTFTSGIMKCSADCQLDTSFCSVTGGKQSCVLDGDCTKDEDICISGVCVSGDDGCLIDSDCANGEICSLSGVCVPKTATYDDCTVDLDCSEGKICSYGSCILLPEEKGVDWLAIVLMVVGILAMGGAGYWLWVLNDEKRGTSQPYMPSTSSRPGGIPSAAQTPLTPEQKVSMGKESEARKQALDKVKKEKEAERVRERKDVFSKFGGEKPIAKKSSQPSGKTQGSKTPSAVGKSQGKEQRTDNEGYIDLSKAKKPEAKKPTQKKTQKPKEDDDVFDALEKI